MSDTPKTFNEIQKDLFSKRLDRFNSFIKNNASNSIIRFSFGLLLKSMLIIYGHGIFTELVTVVKKEELCFLGFCIFCETYVASENNVSVCNNCLAKLDLEDKEIDEMIANDNLM